MGRPLFVLGNIYIEYGSEAVFVGFFIFGYFVLLLLTYYFLAKGCLAFYFGVLYPLKVSSLEAYEPPRKYRPGTIEVVNETHSATYAPQTSESASTTADPKLLCRELKALESAPANSVGSTDAKSGFTSIPDSTNREMTPLHSELVATGAERSATEPTSGTPLSESQFPEKKESQFWSGKDPPATALFGPGLENGARTPRSTPQPSAKSTDVNTAVEKTDPKAQTQQNEHQNPPKRRTILMPM
ncbi:unnamed protein product [Bursaphelenchus okinawaensis]|uniref:Uncharacterized protein n=1 Tax=Bursaphelenchus okinawaensis TaxID=465554 RepID=A0A811JW34_9BILA|nr:unnamed protein product [Bursaphelenchus okinawaensis]CAG9085751.1 unnamed protein product [Bursaphelenchus okinawaensis]